MLAREDKMFKGKLVIALIVAVTAFVALLPSPDTTYALTPDDIQILRLAGNTRVKDNQTKGYSLKLFNNGPATEVMPYLIAAIPVSGCPRPGIDTDNNGTDDSFAALVNLDAVPDSVAITISSPTASGTQSGNDFKVIYGSCPASPGSSADLTPIDYVLRVDACHSGDARPEGLFLGSMAQAIHRVGVRTVVGSRYSLSGSGSVRLTRVLYGELLREGTSLERALLRARAALHHPGGKAGPKDGGDKHGQRSEDAYALQFYARSVEAVRAEDGTEAHREVRATYPLAEARGASGKKAPFHVPFFKNEGFVGRDDDLARLHELLRQGEAVGVRPAAGGPHPAALTGMGGIGKTQLAVEYAYRYRDAYPGGVYWVNAAQRWQAELAALAEKLGLREDSAAEADRERRLALAFGRYLDEHPGALVIFDNVEDPLALREPTPDLIPARLPCRLLFTTRRRDPGSPFATLDVPVLPPDYALRLLLSSEARGGLLSDAPASEIQAAKAICSALGYLPLAIVLASAYLGKFTRIAPSRYLTRLHNNGALAAVDAGNKVDPRKLATHHAAAVEATLRAQWDALESEDARRVLKTAALLREAAQVQRATLSLLTGLGDEAKDGHAAPLEEALHELSGLSLVEDLTERAIRLHPLVREFAENQVDEREAFAAGCAERLCEALWDMGRLHAEVAARGVDAVLEDLREGKRLSVAGGGARIERLMRPLDREANRLRGWDPEQGPAFLLQQLRNRCFELKLEDLRRGAEAKLDEWRLPHLRERIRTSRESDALVRTLEGHPHSVNGVAVTPDGRFAVSASHDKTLKVWELSTGQTVLTLGTHVPFHCCAITSKGKTFLAGDAAGGVHILDWLHPPRPGL